MHFSDCRFVVPQKLAKNAEMKMRSFQDFPFFSFSFMPNLRYKSMSQKIRLFASNASFALTQ
jgi:hypothetical protein